MTNDPGPAVRYELALGRERSEVRTARDFCVRHVTAMVAPGAGADLVADAAMVTSELVTNAMRAGAGRITLQLGADDTVLRIGVRDDATGAVETTETDPLALDGRGLRIVGMLAARWGVTEVPEGKLVWADLSLPGAGHW